MKRYTLIISTEEKEDKRMQEAVIVTRVRRAIGRVSGTLKDITIDSDGGQGITTIVENIM